jgi:predicted kinase
VTHLFFLTGPPAVGKSTTAHALATRFDKSIHIPVDDLREMVVSGLILPSEDWSQALVEQLALARQTAVQMALVYREAGYTVVIDDFWDPNSRLSEYTLLFTEANTHKILLLPNQEAAKSRNIKRSQKALRFASAPTKTKVGVPLLSRVIKTSENCETVENWFWVAAQLNARGIVQAGSGYILFLMILDKFYSIK